MEKKKTIGIFIPIMDRFYQCDLWNGILSQVNKLGYNALFFCGSALEAPYINERNNNIVYQLPDKDTIAGFIVMSGTITNFSGTQPLLNLLSRFDNIPIVHISLELEGYNCITIDNYQSMCELMEHVMKVHDYTNYVFISGPKTNIESIRRTDAFVDCMLKYEVPKENYRIYEGDFTKESVKKIAETMIEEGVKPDIIICANDDLAIGVNNAIKSYEELSYNTAFTGFDDSDNAVTFSPAFTTVRQPLKEMGEASARMIDKLIRGEYTISSLSYAGEVIVRESCGCFSFKSDSMDNDNVRESQVVISGESLQSFYDTLINRIEEIKKNELESMLEKSELIVNSTNIEKIEKIFDVLIEELKGKLPNGTFLKQYYDYIILQNYKLNPIVKELRERLYSSAILYPNEIHDIFYHMGIINNYSLFKEEKKANYDFMSMYYGSSNLIESFTHVSNIESMLETLVSYIEGYNFNGFYVCLYDEPVTYHSGDVVTFPEEIVMRLGYQDKKVLVEERFKTQQVLPSYLREDFKNRGYVVFPLFFKSNQFGYLICDTDITQYPILRAIREQISNTIERINVYKKLEAYTSRLMEISQIDPLTKAYNRRGVDNYVVRLRETEDQDITLGVIYCDIDGLKKINDTYGHSEGDFHIVGVANLLKEKIGYNGIVARIGGDEFVCFLRNVDVKGLADYVQAIQVMTEEYNNNSTKPYKMSISMGQAMWLPYSGNSLDEVLRLSDQDLYNKKRAKYGL